MTNWITPEFDTVCLFWLQGGKQNETPTDKKTLPFQSPPPGGPSAPLFKKRRKEGQTSKGAVNTIHFLRV